MLRGIHKATSTWAGKAVMAVIMGFLVISFAIWGIGDIFRGYGRNAVAKIGSAEISIEQFREYYNDRIQRISRQLGKPISSDQARALGLDRQILGQMIAEITLDQQAKDMRLGLSNAAIANRIQTDPTFNGPDGKFSRQRFEEVIRNAGFTEAAFRRRAAQRDAAPADRPEHQRRHAGAGDRGARRSTSTATRSVASIIWRWARIRPAPFRRPSPETLKKYYDAHKAMFRAPEYRKITLLSLSPQALATPESVTEAEAKAYYEQHKAQYGRPEKREVRQILFPNEADAKAAREKIAKGTSFDDIVKARGLKASDTDIGMVTQAAIIDPAVGKAAFALKGGEVSQPVKGNFGTVLVTVGKIEPGEQKSYADVAAADQKGARRAQGAQQDRRAARQDRGRKGLRRDARRNRQEARPQDPRRSMRSTAPAMAPTASRLPICRATRTS